MLNNIIKYGNIFCDMESALYLKNEGVAAIFALL